MRPRSWQATPANGLYSLSFLSLSALRASSFGQTNQQTNQSINQQIKNNQSINHLISEKQIVKLRI